MGRELNRLRKRRMAKKRFDMINDKREITLVIHYYCESFYDIKDGRTPRVTSIAVRNFDSGQTTSFSIHKSAELSGVSIHDISDHYDDLEKNMLSEFFDFVKTISIQIIVHWNMRDINYGFQAIEHRYKVLGGNPIPIEDSRKVDLARELIALYGVAYAPHGDFGRMHSLMSLNSITAKDALTGAEEAKAFEEKEYVKLHQSTLRKVDVIANLLDRTLDGSLKTKAGWWDLYGMHPVALLEFLTEHWIWGLIVVVSVIISIVSGLLPLF